jgi:thiamine biosynthesis lipoprotein ApbE
MPYIVKVDKEHGDFTKYSALVDGILHNAEQIFSNFLKHSEVSRLNATPRGEPFTLSPEMSKVECKKNVIYDDLSLTSRI